MPRKDAADPSQAPGVPRQVCSGIAIQAIDIVQPPGIGISPIADMEPHQTIVTATLAANSSADRLKKARSEAMCLKISRSPAVTVTLTAWISGWYTRRDGATTFRPSRKVSPRSDPSVRG